MQSEPVFLLQPVPSHCRRISAAHAVSGPPVSTTSQGCTRCRPPPPRPRRRWPPASLEHARSLGSSVSAFTCCDREFGGHEAAVSSGLTVSGSLVTLFFIWCLPSDATLGLPSGLRYSASPPFPLEDTLSTRTSSPGAAPPIPQPGSGSLASSPSLEDVPQAFLQKGKSEGKRLM